MRHGSTEHLENKNRINRATFIFSFVAATILQIILIGGLSLSVGGDTSQDTGIAGLIVGVVFLVLVAYQLRLYRKRLHDRNSSGWWALALYVPLLNIFVIIEAWFLKGDEADNKYGKPPKNIYISEF